MNKRSVLLSSLVVALAFVLILGLTPAAAQSASVATSRSSDVAAPIIENVGQLPAAARFQMRANESTLWLADDAIWITVLADVDAEPRQDPSFALARDGDFTPQRGVNLKLTFPGATPNPRLEPFDRLDMHVSYFLGADPAGWRPDVPAWGGVRYVDLYPGVNLEVSAVGGRLAWRLVGDAAEAVRLRIEGADELRLDGDALRLATAVGELWLPLFERIGSSSKPLATLAQPGVIGDEVVAPFAVPRSPVAPAAVDAMGLVYSTFLGGSGDDYSGAIAVDSTGAAYVIGYTASTNFPMTAGVFDASQNGGNDVFVARLNSSGGSLAYATFVGGSAADEGFGIALDANGNAYVSGHTYSSNFPTTAGAFDTSPNGEDDAFVLKLNPAGTALVYSTVIGGSGRDWSQIIVVNASGEAHIIGTTIGSGFPTTAGAYQTSARGGWDVLAVKLAANGGSLIYSTLLGGGYDDYGSVLALDGAGSVYLSGWTCSSDFPTTTGAFDRTFGGCSYSSGGDTFVTKLNSAGTGLVYSTYLGGSNYDSSGQAIAVNASGEAYVVGFTRSSDFPTTAGAYDTTPNGAEDATLVKLNASGSGQLYGTLLGGSGFDAIWGLAVSGNTAYLSGATASADFPTTADAYDRTYAGGTCGSYACRDVFAAKLDMAANQLVYSTYLGGGNDDYQASQSLAVDGSGAIYLAGWTKSGDFPTTAGAFDANHNGGADVFVVKLGESGAGWTRIYPATTPPIRSYYAMAYDSDRGRTLIFGGVGTSESQCYGETWEYDGVTWTRVATTGPSPRSSAKMVYDTARRQVILFGGYIGCTSHNPSNDTWAYNPTTRVWSQLAPATSPSLRDGGQFAFDSFRQVAVLFGGWNDYYYLNDTWEFNGTNWQQRSPAHAPVGLAGGAFAYDSVRHKVVLVGGFCDGYCDSSSRPEMWEYDGADWTLIASTTPVGPNNSGAMAYDSQRQRLLLFGGNIPSGLTNRTWEYDGTTWTLLSLAVSPTPRYGHQMVYDAARARMVVYGGYDGSGNLNDTWEYAAGGSPTCYPISGRVTDGSGNPVAGVTISDGAGHTATTDASGNYTVSCLSAGTYTLTPSKTNYTFSPASRTISVPPSAPDQNFTATAVLSSIAGRVTDGSGNPIAGVTISDGAGHTATSDASGNYTLSGLAAGTYTLTPSKSGYTFSPASRTVSVPPSATGQNFTATVVVTYSISGRVTDGSSNPVSGVTLSDGVGHTVTTDTSGNYLFSGLAAGTYTVTPSKSGCAFSPPSRMVSLPPNATDQNFTCGTTPTRVKILPANKRAYLTGTFTVTLTVENVTNLGAFQTELIYAPATVHVTAVTLGAFLGSTGRTVTPVGPTIDNTAGKVTFGAFSFGSAAGPNGSGTLAVITFQPRAVGTMTLHLQNLGLADPNGNAIAAATEDGQVQVTNCFGDFDGDNDVDIFDLQRAASHWNCRTGDACYDAQYDTEPDGDIDVFDLQRFAAAWGTVCTTATAQRKAWPAFESATLPEALASASLSLLPAARQAAPGEVITQTVRLADAVNVGAFQTTLTYNPAVVQVEGVTLGAFLGSTGRTVVPVGPTIDNAVGQVTFGAFTFGSQVGVSGAGDLAYVRFRAGTGGQTALAFQGAGLSDPQGNALELDSQTGAEVTVGTQASLLLLPTAQTATAGREFFVTLRVSDAANLAAFQAAVAYNPAVAQATGVALGPF